MRPYKLIRPDHEFFQKEYTIASADRRVAINEYMRSWPLHAYWLTNTIFDERFLEWGSKRYVKAPHIIHFQYQ